MPKFLSQNEAYRLLQRELPPGAYPDGTPDAFNSTADQASVAKALGTLYSNAERVYDNFFPNYADERLSEWEELYLGGPQDAALSLAERRGRLLQKIRSQRRATPRDIKATVLQVIGDDKLVEIVELNCGGGSWILDVSLLDISTILNEFNGLERVGDGLCGLTAADYGLTEEEYLRLRAIAYTYEVRVYGYTLTAAELEALDAALDAAEPARSTHVILDGLDPADMISGST